MIRLFYAFVVTTLILSNNNLLSQINCVAPDSIIVKYKDDADRLALRKISRLHLPYEDSIEIPKIISDSFLNELLAVYNAVSIPERDTVVDIFNIHTFPDLIMTSVVVAADSNLNWMKQLRNGVIPTGYQPLDSIMAKYGLTVEEYKTWSNWFYWHAVYFKSEANYNIPALANVFETFPDVFYSGSSNVAGDGDDISDDLIFIVDENFGHDLFYSVGWGDCLSGCTGRRAWWFKTYDDCSVHFVDVFGGSLPFTGIDEQSEVPVTIRPNPFKDAIWIEGISDSFEYSISDINGRHMVSGKSTKRNISNLEDLIPGIYVLSIKERDKVITHKVIKN